MDPLKENNLYELCPKCGHDLFSSSHDIYCRMTINNVDDEEYENF